MVGLLGTFEALSTTPVVDGKILYIQSALTLRYPVSLESKVVWMESFVKKERKEKWKKIERCLVERFITRLELLGYLFDCFVHRKLDSTRIHMMHVIWRNEKI